MILTKELIHAGMSTNGGWNTLQVIILGESMRYKGWLGRLLGKNVPDEDYYKFLEFKDAHLKKNGYGGRKKAILKTIIAKKDNVNVEVESEVHDIAYKDQYLHPNWQKMRLKVLSRDGFKCLNCGSDNKTLHAHHIKYLKDKYIWEVPSYYIVTLCEDCHSAEHGKDLRSK